MSVRRSHFVVNLDWARGPTAVGAQNWVGELNPLHADVERQGPARVHGARITPGAVGHRRAQTAHGTSPRNHCGEQKYANIGMLRFTTHAEPPQFVVACCDDF